MLKKLKIDEGFRDLIPPLLPDEFNQLESNILSANKCRDALVTWQGTLIDGHNRYQICSKHNIDFDTVELQFDTRDEVILWMIQNQLGRRNLKEIQVAYLLGKQYEAEKKSVTNPGGKNQHTDSNAQDGQSSGIEVVAQNEHQPKTTTAERIGKQHGTSPAKVRRSEKVAKGIDAIAEKSSIAKQMILMGEVDISKRELEMLPDKTEDEISVIALEIENETYRRDKKKPTSKTTDVTSPAIPVSEAVATTDSYSFFTKIVDSIDGLLSKIEDGVILTDEQKERCTKSKSQSSIPNETAYKIKEGMRDRVRGLTDEQIEELCNKKFHILEEKILLVRSTLSNR